MPRARRGAALVEFAIVLPIALLIIFAAFEFGRLLMVMHGLEETAREACRMAVTRTADRADIVELVSVRMALFGVTDSEVEFTPDPPASALQWEPVTVRITARYADASWLPVPGFLRGTNLTGCCTLPQESDVADTRNH